MKSETISEDDQKYESLVMLMFGISIIVFQLFYALYFPEAIAKSNEILRVIAMFILGFVLVISSIYFLEKKKNEMKNRDKRIEKCRYIPLITSEIAIVIIVILISYMNFSNVILNFYDMVILSIIVFIEFILIISNLDCLYKNENEK